jgi:transcriptional regulator with XRE-family HTH domain
LSKIGEEGFSRIAERARIRCIGFGINQAFRKWYFAEMRLGGIRGEKDFAARLEVAVSTASRYLNGKISKTDVLTIDRYLRLIGTSLREVLPDEVTVRKAVMSETIAAILKARRVPKKEWNKYLPPREATLKKLEWLLKRRPLPISAEASSPDWYDWCHQAALLLECPIKDGIQDDGSQSEPAEESLRTASIAADLEFAKKLLPWQIAVLVALSAKEAKAATVSSGVTKAAAAGILAALLIPMLGAGVGRFGNAAVTEVGSIISGPGINAVVQQDGASTQELPENGGVGITTPGIFVDGFLGVPATGVPVSQEFMQDLQEMIQSPSGIDEINRRAEETLKAHP